MFLKDGDEPAVLERLFSETTDARFDEPILEKILSILEAHGVKSVAMVEDVFGCPHEEGAALRAVKDTKGGGHVGAMTGAMVATSIVFFPAAPLFLFMHGKDITIPSGTEITAYVNGDTVFTPPAPSPGTAPVTAVAGTTELVLTSTLDGADIEIDGAFAGNTPSTVQLGAGDHTVRISHKGYQTYEKRIHVSGGKISLRAELEPAKE